MADDVLAGILGGIGGGLEGFVTGRKLRDIEERDILEEAESKARLETSRARLRQANLAISALERKEGFAAEDRQALIQQRKATEEFNKARAEAQKFDLKTARQDETRLATERGRADTARGLGFLSTKEFRGAAGPEAVSAGVDLIQEFQRTGALSPESIEKRQTLEDLTVSRNQILAEDFVGPPQTFDLDPAAAFGLDEQRKAIAAAKDQDEKDQLAAIRTAISFFDDPATQAPELLAEGQRLALAGAGFDTTDGVIADDGTPEETGFLQDVADLALSKPFQALREQTIPPEVLELEEGLLDVLEAHEATNRLGLAEIGGGLAGTGGRGGFGISDLSRLFEGSADIGEGQIYDPLVGEVVPEAELSFDLPPSLSDRIIAKMDGFERQDFTRLDEQSQRVFLLREAIGSQSLIAAAAAVKGQREGAAGGALGSDVTATQLGLSSLGLAGKALGALGLGAKGLKLGELIGKGREGLGTALRGVLGAPPRASATAGEKAAEKFLQQTVGGDIGAFAQKVGGAGGPPALPQAQRLLPAPQFVPQRPGTSAVAAPRGAQPGTATRPSGPTINLPGTATPRINIPAPSRAEAHAPPSAGTGGVNLGQISQPLSREEELRRAVLQAILLGRV